MKKTSITLIFSALLITSICAVEARVNATVSVGTAVAPRRVCVQPRPVRYVQPVRVIEQRAPVVIVEQPAPVVIVEEPPVVVRERVVYREPCCRPRGWFSFLFNFR